MRSFGAAALTDLVRALSTPRRAVVPDAGASPAATDGAGGATLETFDIADRDFNGAPDDIEQVCAALLDGPRVQSDEARGESDGSDAEEPRTPTYPRDQVDISTGIRSQSRLRTAGTVSRGRVRARGYLRGL